MLPSTACPACGVTVVAGARYCLNCGSDVTKLQGSLATEVVPTSPGRRLLNDASILDELRLATLGDYDILTQLGQGGMATVYLAHDIALDRKVAIKVMSPLMVYGEGMAERFKREARTAASLGHPHIIPIFAVREKGDLLFFVMKYVDGRPLDSIVRDLGPLPVPLVATILGQVAAALAHAHRRGVVHRDIKPANIMLDHDGYAVVTDFGIAKVQSAEGLTATGASVGTPAYMSPEQCSGRPLTGSSDQYSLGIVGYELLTGQPPFRSDTMMGLMWAHVNEPASPVLQHRTDCPRSLAVAIMRMLEKDPAERWASLEDVAVALGSAAADEGARTQMMSIARTPTVDRPAAPPTPVSPSPPGRAPATGPVAVVTISPRDGRITAGEHLHLNASVRTRDGTLVLNPLITWASNAPGVATVSSVGELTAHRSGIATITAVCQGLTGTATVRVARASASLTRLGSGRRLAWIGGVGLTVAGILAVFYLKSRGTDDATKSPANPPLAAVASVTLTPEASSLVTGDSAQLTVSLADSVDTILPLDSTRIDWKSAAPSVATVNENGIVRGLAVGTAFIVATVARHSDTARVTVSDRRVDAAALELTPADTSIPVGRQLHLNTRLTSKDGSVLIGRALRWRSSDPAVARVDSATGLIETRRTGRATITATSEDGPSGAVRLIVLLPIARLVLSPATATLGAGDSLTPTIQLIDSEGKLATSRPVAWVSDNHAVAEVDPAVGRVLALREGSTRIVATVEGRSASLNLTVSAPVRSIAAVVITRTDSVVQVGTSLRLSASARDRNGVVVMRAITWQSLALQTATVDPSGTVSGKQAGRAPIVAAADGLSDTLTLNITAASGTSIAATDSTDAGGASSFAELSVGGVSSCGLLKSGEAFCWGGDQPRGVLFNGLVLEKLALGNGFACGLTPAGEAYCWGSNGEGQLGDGTMRDRAAPVAVDVRQTFADLSAGGSHACGLTSAGVAYCWGANNAGQIGDGSKSRRARPVRVIGNFSFQSISAGDIHTCGITREGKAYCWGDGLSNQLGNGKTGTVTEPDLVRGNLTFRSVAVGARHSCGLTTTGQAYCWGENKRGQLGNDTQDDRNTPDSVYTDQLFRALTAGTAHTCGLTTRGQVLCWGDNASGQLGDGSRRSRNLPGPITTSIGRFLKVSTGSAHTCALAVTGQLVCWGANLRGQLGGGSSAQLLATPTVVNIRPQAGGS
ncbi:MAG: Ig-like domain-containing protein [Gemmatimonadota bacterium]